MALVQDLEMLPDNPRIVVLSMNFQQTEKVATWLQRSSYGIPITFFIRYSTIYDALCSPRPVRSRANVALCMRVRVTLFPFSSLNPRPVIEGLRLVGESCFGRGLDGDVCTVTVGLEGLPSRAGRVVVSLVLLDVR